MLTPFSSFGTLLKVGDGDTPEVFTTIGGVKDIGGPALSLDSTEADAHDQTWGQRVVSMLRMGEITFNVNFDPAYALHDDASGLIADMVAKKLRNYQLVFTDDDTTTWAFAAFVTNVGPSAPVNGVLEAAVTLSPSGGPTIS